MTQHVTARPWHRRVPADVWRVVTTMAAVLGTFATALALHEAFGFGSALVVLSVVLSLTLGRHETDASSGARAARLATLVLVAVAAHLVAVTLFDHAVLGTLLLVAGLSLPIAIRRFGPTWSRLGTLMSLPLVAVLTTPAVAAPAPGDTWWAPVMAVVAYAWVVASMLVARAGGVAHATPPPAPARTRPARRLDASARMAIQMATSLGLSAVIGHLAFGGHWPWLVITAFVVCAGNRGRGDVLVKGAERVVGAVVGTLLATLLAGHVARGSHLVVALVFVALAVGVWLRPRGYAFWAASITAALALLYGFYGVGGTHLLAERVLGVVIGGIIAVAVSWVVVPVRSHDVALLRVADVLRAVQEVLDEHLRQRLVDHGELDAAIHDLHPIRSTWAVHRRTTRDTATPADAIESVDELVLAVRGLPERADRAVIGRAARQLGAARRRLRDERSVASLTGDLRSIAQSVRDAAGHR
ncbi:FUSC family protein [Aeromicrobium fastidiosum]|nr:FUSC family protein [Aeromicrobium fastidiosum]MBP2390332.1 hypothetical protein [Aeromicrobium fastidiosum]